MAAAAVATALGLLTRFLLREWQLNATLVAVLCALSLTAPHILARPHILALPVMVAWIAALIRAVDTRSAPPWHLLPLMTLWTNLHGSFTFGLAMIAPIACEALWRASPSARPVVARQWLSFALLALAAACLNPYGPEMILVTFRTVALGARGRVALAGFYPSRRVRSHYPRRLWFCALPRRDFAVATNRNVIRCFAPRVVASTTRRPSGNARTDISARPLAEQFKAIAAASQFHTHVAEH
ncbi:MAG: hypothetical protein WA759_05580 [Pseudolabrys sp.]